MGVGVGRASFQLFFWAFLTRLGSYLFWLPFRGAHASLYWGCLLGFCFYWQ